MQTIDSAELKLWLDEGRPFALVEVLGPEAFQHFHLPKAINVPLRAPGFEQAIQRAVADRRAPVVVYAQDSAAPDGAEAAARIEGLGFSEVRLFPGGKVEWQQAGLPTEQNLK